MEQQIHIFSGYAGSGSENCFTRMKRYSSSLALKGWFVHDTSTITSVDHSGKVLAEMVVTYRRLKQNDPEEITLPSHPAAQ